MAAQLNIDFSNMGAQITKAVKEGVIAATKATTGHGEPKEKDFDIREQILSNAYVIERLMKPRPSFVRDGPLKVIVTSDMESASAKVVGTASGYVNGGWEKGTFVFLRSEDCDGASSASAALETLLKVTMMMLDSLQDEDLLYADKDMDDVVVVAGYNFPA